jgi:hypothetical protein
MANQKVTSKYLSYTQLEIWEGVRGGKGKTWKTIDHAAFSVLQRWQIYTNIAPFVEAVNRYQLIR